VSLPFVFSIRYTARIAPTQRLDEMPGAELGSMKKYLPSTVLMAQLALSAAFLVACGGKTDSPTPVAGASGPARPAGPAVPVTTVRARQQDFPVMLQAIGTVAPVASVDVKPQVSSVVTRVFVTEGQFVRAGQPLFALDSRNDEANVAKMRAQMAKDEASLADARRQLARSKELLRQNFVSQGAVDANQATVDAQAAAVDGDRAALDAARVALSYSQVKAPSSGRAGAINVYPGTAVQVNQTTLVTVTQLDPIDVSFSLPQRYLNNALAALNGGTSPVAATLPEATGELAGKLQFVDNAIDAGTGTVKVKARFPNPASKLWPGAFVNVNMKAGLIKDAIVVPVATVIQSARGPIVYVVENGKAVLRPVKVIEMRGEDAAVTGIKAGDKVVLDGRQNLRPDSAVSERPQDGGSGKAGPAASAAASPGRLEKTSAP
jgi:RND family efflux transporter MFP subunit